MDKMDICTFYKVLCGWPQSEKFVIAQIHNRIQKVMNYITQLWLKKKITIVMIYSNKIKLKNSQEQSTAQELILFVISRILLFS